MNGKAIVGSHAAPPDLRVRNNRNCARAGHRRAHEIAFVAGQWSAGRNADESVVAEAKASRSCPPVTNANARTGIVGDALIAESGAATAARASRSAYVTTRSAKPAIRPNGRMVVG